MLIVEDVLHPLRNDLLDDEDVRHGTAGLQFLTGKAQRSLPGVISGTEPMKRMHQRIAARQRDRHHIGVELHLPRQRSLREHNEAEHRVQQRAQRPDHEAKNPADPRDAEIETGKPHEETIEDVALIDDVGGHLLRNVDPAADGHRSLTEMPELVCEHRFELAEVQTVDEGQPDLEILLRGEDQIEQRQIVEHGRIHTGRQEHAVRSRCAGFIGQAEEELEELRLVLRGDLDVVDLAAVIYEEERLHEKHGQECRAARRDVGPEFPLRRIRGGNEVVVSRPREPAGQRQVQRDEQHQAEQGYLCLALVRRTRRGQIVRDRFRAWRVQMVHTTLLFPQE